MSASDAELVRSHDARAFGVLYARHAEAVHGWFAARVAWAAADLTAETFARAWLARRSFRDGGQGRGGVPGPAEEAVPDGLNCSRIQRASSSRRR